MYVSQKLFIANVKLLLSTNGKLNLYLYFVFV